MILYNLCVDISIREISLTYRLLVNLIKSFLVSVFARDISYLSSRERYFALTYKELESPLMKETFSFYKRLDITFSLIALHIGI